MKARLAWLITLGFLASAVVPFGAAAQRRAETCRPFNVRGSFGFVENGSIVGFGQYSAVGTIISDGAGNMHGVFTESAAGNIASGVTFVGTYSVNPDCTGTAELSDSLGRTGTRAFVIVQEGKEIQYLFTDPGFVATGVAKKQ